MNTQHIFMVTDETPYTFDIVVLMPNGDWPRFSLAKNSDTQLVTGQMSGRYFVFDGEIRQAGNHLYTITRAFNIRPMLRFERIS